MRTPRTGVALALLLVTTSARADPTLLASTESGAGTLRWAPRAPEDVYAYERLSAALLPSSGLTATALAMVLRERLSGTSSPPGTTWLFGGGAEYRPTDALAFSAFGAGVPTAAGPDGARRWLATGGVSASYDGIATGPFMTGLELTGTYAHLAFLTAGAAPVLDQWSIGGTVTESLDEETDLSVAITGYLYGGDTALLSQAGAHFGAARGAGMMPYRLTVRTELERDSRPLSGRVYWQIADLAGDAGHEVLAGAEIGCSTGARLTPLLGAEGGIRDTAAGVVPMGVVWVGARLALGRGG